MTEKTTEWVRKVIEETGPPSDDPNMRIMQQIEFRKKWDAAKKDAREQAEREKRQAELQRYLDRRGREWVETTGSTWGLDEQRACWRAEYMDDVERRRQAEYDARLYELDQEHYRFP